MPLIAWSLRAFEATPAISEIVIVAPKEGEEKFREIARQAGVTKLSAVVSGGAHRHESVLCGLNEVARIHPSVELVIIHDAARPLVTPALITRCLEMAAQTGASSAATPVTDTLHQSDQQNYAVRTVDRVGLWAMQTPQVFRAAPLTKLLREVKLGSPTDEVSVVLAAGWRVALIENLQANLKITWPDDFAMAEALLKSRVF